MLGITLSYEGTFPAAERHLRQFLSLNSAQRPDSHVFAYGQDLEVTGLSYASRTLWLLGYEEGMPHMQENLAAEQTMGIELGKPRLLALLAEAYGKIGH